MTGQRHVLAILIDRKCSALSAARPPADRVRQGSRQRAERKVDAALAIPGAGLLLAKLGQERRWPARLLCAAVRCSWRLAAGRGREFVLGRRFSFSSARC